MVKVVAAGNRSFESGSHELQDSVKITCIADSGELHQLSSQTLLEPGFSSDENKTKTVATFGL